MKFFNRRILLLTGLTACIIVILFIYQNCGHITCYIVSKWTNDMPPKYLVKKWTSPLLGQGNREKFPLRNDQLIEDRLGTLAKLMKPLNDILTKLASKQSEGKLKPWPESLNEKQELHQIYDSFYHDISSSKLLRTFAIDMNFTNLTPLLQREYFNSTAINCADFITRGVMHIPSEINPGCSDDPSNVLDPMPLNMGLINQGMTFPSKSEASSIPVSYISVLGDAFVNGETGDIATQNLQLFIQRCVDTQQVRSSSHQVNSALEYDQVLSIAQYWGIGYFHHTSEQLPRMVLYLQFLRQNPQVYVHVSRDEPGFVYDTLNLLGVAKSRIISGDIRARVLYSPVGGRCGTIPIIQGQMLSLLLRQQITSPPKRRSVVLIKRSSKRYFYCHDSIKEMLEVESATHGLELEVYGDSPSPSIRETAEMFNRAVIVVAPHGAGLSNMFFSEPGTVIIEGTCFDWNNSKLNHCYEHSALVLGHRYVAINYPHKSCHYFQASDVKPVVKYFLNSFFPLKNSL